MSLGVGIAGVTSIGPRFTLATEFQCLGQSLARRLITPRGSMPWAPGDGTDMRDYLNKGNTPQNRFAAQRAAKDECERDERVELASVTAAFAADALTLTVSVVTAVGSFTLVLLVDALSVSQLNLAVTA